jgi:hypothetical protein
MTRHLLVLLLLSLTGAAQSSVPVPSSANAAPATSVFDVSTTLSQIDQTAQSAALQIAALRIEKWKADSQSKQQAQSNADSLQRNMTAALPSLTGAVRTRPQDLSANFKLYRNLSALSDVLNTLAESAGAFGPKQEFESLAEYASRIDQSRRSLGDYLEVLTAAKEAELARLRSGAPATATTTRPKRVIVDNEPDPKPKPKKRKQ